MYNTLIIFLGGGIGSLARFGISEFVRTNIRPSFPVSTLISNTLSCLVLALAMGVFADKVNTQPGLKALIVVGFCGGFSTFSTFSYETVELIRAGNTMIALLNVLLSIAICFSIVYFIARSN